jgi:hypothetical protein
MTDETPIPATRSRRRAKGEIVEAEVVEAEVVEEPPVPAAPSTAVATTNPPPTASQDPPVAESQVVYVHLPAPPLKKGNRGVGSLIALLSGILFAALLALATGLVGIAGGGRFTLSFVADARFYIPVLFFIIGFVLLVLIVNRASWWVYIIGSVVVAVFVYFGTVGAGLLTLGIISRTPAQAAELYQEVLRDPFVIVSAVLAREVVIWMGAVIASRGRRVKARNIAALAQHDAEVAAQRAGQVGSATPAAPAA